MPLYDIFKPEIGGIHPYRHIARKEFPGLGEVVAYCKAHKFKFLESSATDERIRQMQNPQESVQSEPVKMKIIKATKQVQAPAQPQVQPQDAAPAAPIEPVAPAAPPTQASTPEAAPGPLAAVTGGAPREPAQLLLPAMVVNPFSGTDVTESIAVPQGPINAP